ncbi:hypothetical protein ACE6H2_018160 [Prunus campanulata]
MAAAIELTSGQDHTLTMASRHDTSKIEKSLRKVSEMEKSLGELGEIWEMKNSHGEPGKISEMEKSLAELLSHQIQLVHLKKLIWDELHICRASSLKHGAVHPYPGSGGQDRSVFLMVTFDGGKYTGAIYEVKFKFGGEVDDMGGGGAPKPVATFNDFNVRGARIFNRSELYVFTDEDWDKPDLSSFRGSIFNTKTRKLDSFTPSTVQFKACGTVVSAYGTLYFLEAKGRSRSLGFGKYNPNKKDWVRLPLFPFSYEYIMNVTGRAVVVGETIYALNMFKVDAIIAYSLRRKVDDDGDIAYSLVQLYKLNGLEIADPPLQFGEFVTDYLVHLGNQDIVHVKSGTNEECDEVQHLCITTFQIVQEGTRHMIETLHSIVLPVDIEAGNWFMLTFGFTS